jgi:hypothetical protein
MKWVIAKPSLAVLDDDWQDRYWAGTASAVLHLALILLALVSSAGGSRRSGDSLRGKDGASTMVSFEPTEFRQKVELVARSEDSPRPTKPFPKSVAHPPIDSARSPPKVPEAISPFRFDSASSIAEPLQAGALATIPQTSTSAGTTGAAGNSGNTGLRDAYLRALRTAILDKWGRPNANLTGCTIALEQDVNGLVVSARVGDCTLNAEQRDSLESAALMAQPLPYAGYETVFEKRLDLNLDFKNRSE